MEFLLIILAAGVALYWLVANSRRTRDRVTITERRSIKTEDGSVEVERVSEVDQRKMELMSEAAKAYKERLHRERKTITPPTRPTTKQPPPPPHITAMQPVTPVEPERHEPPSQVWSNYLDQHRQAHQGRYISSSAPLPPSVQPQISAPPAQVKTCGGCAKTLSHARFRANSNQPDGLTQWCATCLDQRRESGPYKVCSRCKQRRMKSSFPKNSKRPDGLTKWCKFCLIK